MKINKYLSILVLILMSLLLTAFSYAYWVGNIGPAVSQIYDFDGKTVEVGSGKNISTTIDFKDITKSTESKFVPAGREANSVDAGSVSEVKFTFKIAWVEKNIIGDPANDVKGTLVLDNKKVSINGSEYPDLFTVNVDYEPSVTLNGDSKLVTVTVKFVNEPKNKAEYALVANQMLDLQLTFSASEN